jgi:predicted AlkP superfamily phosphohydrolase/phosphomutase
VIAVLQVDAVSVTLLERLLEEDRLPRLAALRDRGVWHRLRTPAEHFAGASFHTLYTGLEVGRHGLYYAFQWDAAAQRVRWTEDFPAPPSAWQQLDGAGARCLALDLYESRPPTRFGGSFAAGVQFANRVAMPARSVPAALGRELRRTGGRAPSGEEVFGRQSLESLRTLARTTRQAPGRISRAAAELLARERYDCVWIGLCAAHLAGHWLWNTSQLPAADRETARREGLDRVLEEVYERLDESLGAIVDALPGDADLVVVSPLGMEENSSRSDLLPGMLDAVLAGGAKAATANGDGGSLWRLRSRVPTGLRARIAQALPDALALELTARLDLRGVDWSRTRAFPLAGDHHGHVRLNLRGRERHGIVEPAEADGLLDEIAAGLLTFADPDGAPAVESVVRTADVVDGPATGDLPDLVVRWSTRPSTELAGVGSPRFGDVVRPGGGSGTGRSGGHADDAWALVVPGRSAPREPGRPASVADVAATALGVLGVPADGLDGEPLLEPAA